MALISAVRKADNRKVVIPEHWLDHPILGAAFKRRPSITTKKAESSAEATTATDKKEN